MLLKAYTVEHTVQGPGVLAIIRRPAGAGKSITVVGGEWAGVECGEGVKWVYPAREAALVAPYPNPISESDTPAWINMNLPQ